MPDSEREQRNTRLVMALATIAAALVLLVVASSAWLRLAQNGLGCDGWPACYGAFRNPGEAAPISPAPDTMHVAEVRATHRVAASSAGLAIAMAAVIWLAGNRRNRGAAAIVVALLALTAFLAVLGRYTAAVNSPAITLGNMLGGMVLLALAWTLRAKLTPPPAFASRALDRSARLALLLAAAQIVLGGLVSAKHAALDCAGFPDCNGVWWPEPWRWEAFDPFHELAAADGGLAHALRRTLHVAHRYCALLTAIAAVALVTVTWRGGGKLRAQGVWVAALLMLQLALGAALILAPPSLWVTVAHDVVAALMLAAIAAIALGKAAG